LYKMVNCRPPPRYPEQTERGIYQNREVVQ
jgi:hypothetical protein